MKTLFITLIGLFFASAATAQQPVEWSFYTKKVSNNTYEVYLSATIDKGWHIYSQNSSKKGPAPTLVAISSGPNMRLTKNIKEDGTLIKKKTVEGVSVQYYENALSFVQTVTVSGAVTEWVKGTISYVAANAAQTLQPHTVEFTLKLEQ